MTKLVYTICIIVCSYLFSWIANLLGAGYFSGWGIVANTIGAILGIYIGYKINSNLLEDK
jgi:hypothetical protein